MKNKSATPILPEWKSPDKQERLQRLATILSETLNTIMEQERKAYLAQHPEDRANGYYPRKLQTLQGTLSLNVPRVRHGNAFRPAILPPPWQRVDAEYEHFLLSLLANGYSRRQIKLTLKSIPFPFQEDTLQDLLERIQETFQIFQTRTLEEEYVAIYLDAFHTKMRQENRKVVPIVLYTVVGITREGKKEVLGFWWGKGKENKEFWERVLEDLYQRGVKKVLVFVSDDFPGLTESIRKLYPTAQHQLCLIHLKRNLERRLDKEEKKAVQRLFYTLRQAEDPEEGEGILRDFLEKRKTSRWASFIRYLEQRIDHYVVFLRFPEAWRRHLYTTNPVESLHAGLRDMQRRLGGYFPSQQALETNWFLQIINKHWKWEKRPISAIAQVPYEVESWFNRQFPPKTFAQEVKA